MCKLIDSVIDSVIDSALRLGYTIRLLGLIGLIGLVGGFAAPQRAIAAAPVSSTLTASTALIVSAASPASPTPAATAATASARYPNLGRPASAREIAAWNIDVRPDWQGLPPGSGSAAQGQVLWDEQCASCHGTFGEANHVFPPIIGGTTAADSQQGRVAALANNKEPQRSTMMKLATLSTLWDYIRRAMPWQAPKSLTPDQVYALTAYILHLAELVPGDFVLNQTNIAEIEKKLPNRNGLSRSHGLWHINGRPDVSNPACMKNCPGNRTPSSVLPGSARNAHGNLALQQRSVGPVRGIDTSGNGTAKASTAAATGSASSASTITAPTITAPAAAASAAAASSAASHPIKPLVEQHCSACHHAKQALVGPAFSAIAAHYPKNPANLTKLVQKIKQGGVGAWGNIPMPPQTGLSDGEIMRLAEWLLDGAQLPPNNRPSP